MSDWVDINDWKHTGEYVDTWFVSGNFVYLGVGNGKSFHSTELEESFRDEEVTHFMLVKRPRPPNE